MYDVTPYVNKMKEGIIDEIKLMSNTECKDYCEILSIKFVFLYCIVFSYY